MDIYYLPNDILNLILYNYLPTNDIKSCLLIAKLFNVLSNQQLDVIKKASGGWYKCIGKGYLTSAKWLYELSVKSNNPIDIHENDDFAFKTCCDYCPLEMAQWLYELSVELKNPIDIHKYARNNFTRLCHNGQFELVKWLCEVGVQLNKPIDINYNYTFEMCCHNNQFEIAKWVYELSVKSNKPLNTHAGTWGDFWGDYGFRTFCRYNNVKAAQWFCSLNDKYSVVIENDKLVNYFINNKEVNTNNNSDY